MIWRRIEGGVRQLKGVVRQQLAKLTDEQSGVISDKQDRLADKIQEIYGVTKVEAKQKLSGWLKIQKETANPGSKTPKPK